MAEEVKILFLKGICALKPIKGDMYIGVQFSPLVRPGRGAVTVPATDKSTTDRPTTDRPTEVTDKPPEFCTTTKRYMGFKLSQAILLSHAMVETSAKFDPPRLYLPFNERMAVMVRPVQGLQSDIEFPEEQMELQLEFWKHPLGAEAEEDSPGGILSVFPYVMTRHKWNEKVAAKGRVPFESPIYFGHIITPVAVTVPGGKLKTCRKAKRRGDHKFNDLMTNAVFFSQSEFKKGKSHGYMGFHFSTHNKTVKFDKPDKVQTTVVEFTDSMLRGFRVVHHFGLVENGPEFRKVSLVRRSDGVVMEGRQWPVYASVFMMYHISLKPIRCSLPTIPEEDEEESEDDDADDAQGFLPLS